MFTYEDVDANVAKQRGLYADLLAGGVISRPSDVTEGEAAEAVATAREVGGAAALLHDQAVLARLADPPAEALPVVEAVFRGWFEAEPAQDAEGAAAFVAGVVARLAPAEAPQETGQAGPVVSPTSP